MPSIGLVICEIGLKLKNERVNMHDTSNGRVLRVRFDLIITVILALAHFRRVTL